MQGTYAVDEGRPPKSSGTTPYGALIETRVRVVGIVAAVQGPLARLRDYWNALIAFTRV